MVTDTATLRSASALNGWSVVLRHPELTDLATGLPGRRIRRSLGTRSQEEAETLVDELNELLRERDTIRIDRAEASRRYSPRVVQIFFDTTEISPAEFSNLRDRHIPLPDAETGYTRVLLLGTTGAGKTTVVRQLLGTNPDTERFPSTSTAKTTVADAELITSTDTMYRAAVTFVARDEVIDYLTENVEAAAVAAFLGRKDEDIERKLLDHVDQRYRFSYTLGRGHVPDEDELLDDDADIGATTGVHDELKQSGDVLRSAVSAVKYLVDCARSGYKSVPETDGDRTHEELLEEYVADAVLRDDGCFDLVDSLVDEIEKRFAAVSNGDLTSTNEGWPTAWYWECADRAEFIRVVSLFSSNYAPLFGSLLTPLVNGIRVSGPFLPTWASEPSQLVLIDGQGIGHTPKSVATLSSHVAGQLDAVDAILLVDNAAQPMQAAPVAALKSIAVSGNATKLHFLFTHFDQVTGDNLPTFSERRAHVLASAENALRAIREELGASAERILRERVEEANFVGSIQAQLSADRGLGRSAISQFRSLLERLAIPRTEVELGPSLPVYDRLRVSTAVTDAARAFRDRWDGLLGIQSRPNVRKEHWTRIKALSRRVSEGWTDEYDSLQPAADLRDQLQKQIYIMLQQPVRWSAGQPSDMEKQAVIDNISNAVTRELVNLTRKRLVEERRQAWLHAYLQHGAGSTLVRARIIADDVYDSAAPAPRAQASPDHGKLLQEVADVVSRVANDQGIQLI